MCQVYVSCILWYSRCQSKLLLNEHGLFSSGVSSAFLESEFILWMDVPIAQNLTLWPPIIVVVAFITVLIRILEARNRKLAERYTGSTSQFVNSKRAPAKAPVLPEVRAARYTATHAEVARNGHHCSVFSLTQSC